MIKGIIDLIRDRLWKNVDSSTQAHFIRSCGWVYAAVFLILRFTVYTDGMAGTLQSAVVAIVPAIILGIPIYFFSTKVGGWFGIFYGGRKARWKTDDLIAAALEKIRFSKRAGKQNEALRLANNVLSRFPEHPEVMFVKAQILWEGFGYGNTARRYFRRVMEIVPEGESLHRWAASYLEAIEASPSNQKEGGQEVVR